MSTDVKLTETNRVCRTFANGQVNWGTLTGRNVMGPGGPSDPALHEVVFDSMPNEPVWLSDFSQGDEYETAIMVQYPTDCPEEAALSLLQRLRDDTTGPVYVHCKGLEDGFSYGVRVTWADGVPTASLEWVHASKNHEDQPEWAKPLVEKAKAARVAREVE